MKTVKKSAGKFIKSEVLLLFNMLIVWRNGSALDFESNGCGFESHHGRFFVLFIKMIAN